MTQTIEELLSFIRLQALLGVELDEQCPPIEAAHDAILAAYYAQAERIAELETQLQSFKDFNAPLLEMIAEEEPGAWDHLQEATDEQS